MTKRQASSAAMLVGILAATSSCGGYDGVWVPVTVENVLSVNGHVYAAGTFEPKRNVRGDAALITVDVERLLSASELVAPNRDLSKSPVREWNSGRTRVVAQGASKLFGIRHGNEPVPNQTGMLTSAGITRWDLREPLRPTVEQEVDVATGDGYVIDGTTVFGESLLILRLTRIDNRAPLKRAVAVTLPSLEMMELSPALEGCQEWLADAERSLLHCVVPADGNGTPSQIDTYRVGRAPVGLERIGHGDAPELTQITGSALRADGALMLTQPGAKESGASVFAYRVGEGAPTRLATWQVTEAVVLSALRPTQTGRWLAQATGTVVLFELPDTGEKGNIVATLTDVSAAAFASLGSSSSATSERFAAPLGKLGLAIIEVEGTKLTLLGGFFHAWRDGAPFTIRTGLYPRR